MLPEVIWPHALMQFHVSTPRRNLGIWIVCNVLQLAADSVCSFGPSAHNLPSLQMHQLQTVQSPAKATPAGNATRV